MTIFGGLAAGALLCAGLALPAGRAAETAAHPALAVSINDRGEYVIGMPGANAPALAAGVAAEVDGMWIHSSDYPHHAIQETPVQGYLGAAQQWTVTFSGLTGKPNLEYRLRAYQSEPFADVAVSVENHTGQSVEVDSIRSVEATGDAIVALAGPAAADRVLSDSFSEDRPAMQVHDLGDATHGMYRAVGSQLIYNRQSQDNLFVGALTSDRFLTILRLHVDGTAEAPRIVRYEVDSTGTTEMEEENSLEKSPAEDRVELRLPVEPGATLSSETIAISAGNDYHRELETYGSLIRQMHHARVAAPPLMGWWSWTAYYFGLNEGAALTNAAWLAQHLKSFGYDLFHIDEGYQYARGEYVTANSTVFPHGLGPVEYQVRGLGLTPGIWTAPFEVSERSKVYRDHRDWLVKNAAGQPIHAGFVDEAKDQLYILDTTNPGAQQYLRDTYGKLVRDWGIHYIKMDFMDDSAIEGYYYKPHTTAMEAQRIGLKTIRETVGDEVYLDKDGSAMLNPVGYVDYGRISQDTGHSFEASRDAASGIAARYYMNRNFYVADPDAFTVSTQRITDQSWHEGKAPLTLDEAKVSIALAAVSGGMLEIGDNLPSLENSPDRLALIENRDLIDMVRLGQASVPMDLMSYATADRQPSIFYLRESPQQSILTVFNWTEGARPRQIRLEDLGLKDASGSTITDVFDHGTVDASSGSLEFEQAPHSVRMLKIVTRNGSAAPFDFAVDCPRSGTTGVQRSFAAHAGEGDPAISLRWDFGDGVEQEGAAVRHAWTEPGDYAVRASGTGLSGAQRERTCAVHVTGLLPTVFAPEKNARYQQK